MKLWRVAADNFAEGQRLRYSYTANLHHGIYRVFWWQSTLRSRIILADFSFSMVLKLLGFDFRDDELNFTVKRQ